MAQATPRLLNRQKLLLSLLDALGGECGNLDFQKLLFLMCDAQEVPAYEFVPYQYGAFSFTCYADRRKLIERGWLADVEREWKLAPDVEAEAYCAEEVAGFVAEVGTLRGDDLVASTYRRFPYFASRSKIAKQVLGDDAEALGRIAKSTPPRGTGGLFTIGYEGRSLEAYLNLLLRSGITVLCDVRRNPLSRKYGFSKGALSGACAKLGIEYRHIPALGIASADRKVAAADDAFARLFREYSRTTLRTEGEHLNEIRGWIDAGETVALTCYEEQPEDCHRHCVAQALQGLEARHL